MNKCDNCKHFINDKICAIKGFISNHLACKKFESNQQPKSEYQPQIRQFDTGATRDTDANKIDYEGFLSPLVLKRYAEYLNKHRVQSDGNLRDSDNWQKGIPIKEYFKSKVRHGFASWLLHRGFPAFDEKGNEIDLEESLCAELFNTMGYLFEILKKKQNGVEK